MSEQDKQTRLWSLIIIFTIISPVLVIWPGCKKQPIEQPVTEHQYHEHSPSEHIPENADELNRPKLTLNDVIKAARTWRPAHTSWHGKTAPDFTLTDINGKQHKLSDYRGKNAMLVFWSTGCPPCLMEIPDLLELRKTVSEDDLAILAITSDDPAMIKKFAADKKINYTVLLDRGTMPRPFGVMRIYGTTGIPGSFFIEPDGRIKLATVGLLPLRDTKAIIQAE